MAEAIRQFVTDDLTGQIRLMFTDAQSGAEVPLNQLLDYDILSQNGLGELIPVNAGLKTPSAKTLDQAQYTPATPAVTPIPDRSKSREVSDSFNKDPRTQGNNFGYVNKPSIMGFTNNIPGPIGTASRLANGIVNSNNALATSAARQSMGLAPSSGLGIAKGTLMGGVGQVADVNANGQTYSVGLEAMTKDNRTTLTPSEARNRALTSGTAVQEATPEQSQQNVSTFSKDTGVTTKGLLGRVADTVLGRETSAPLAQTTPTATSIGPQQALGAPSGPVVSSRAPSIANTSVGSVRATAASSLGVNMTGKGLLGAPNKAVPSFAAASAMKSDNIPSVPASNFPGYGTTNSLNQPSADPGLAGISKSFNAGKFGTLGTMDRTNLDPGLNKALNSVEKTMGPNVGINSGYRDPATNARVDGAKASQHIQGKAVDINTVGWSDEDKAKALDAAATAGVKGVGIYNGGRSLHIDTRENFGTWGPSPKGQYAGVAIDAQPSWARDTLTAIQDAGPYNPGPRVGPTPVSRETALSMPSAPSTATGSVTAQRALGYSSTAPGAVTNAGLASMVNSDVSKQRVGTLQNMGFAPNYTDKEVNTLAAALAGELDPRTQAAAIAGNPAALAEAASMTSALSNRLGAKGLKAITDPTQVNAFSSKAMPNGTVPSVNTEANFSKYGAGLAGVVKGVMSGDIQSPTPDATHYANRDVSYASNASYNKDMTSVAKVGDHTFGTINGEFNGKTAAAKEQADRARQAVSNFSDYSGISRQEQSADRKATSTVGAPSTGLGSKSKAAEATKSATDSAKASDSSSSKDKSDSSKGGSDKSGPSKSGSGVGASGKSSSSAGAGAKGGASVGGSASKSSSTSSSGAKASGSAKSSSGAGAKGGASVSGKGVGSSKSSSSSGSKSNSSGAKGAQGARS